MILYGLHFLKYLWRFKNILIIELRIMQPKLQLKLKCPSKYLFSYIKNRKDNIECLQRNNRKEKRNKNRIQSYCRIRLIWRTSITKKSQESPILLNTCPTWSELPSDKSTLAGYGFILSKELNSDPYSTYSLSRIFVETPCPSFLLS